MIRPHAAVIEALEPGADWTALLYKADGNRRDTGMSGSLRIRIGRAVSDDEGALRFCAELQEEVDSGEWRSYDLRRRDFVRFQESDRRRWLRVHADNLDQLAPFFDYASLVVEAHEVVNRTFDAWTGAFANLANGFPSDREED